jgi:DNA-binding response OmpR family regulator
MSPTTNNPEFKKLSVLVIDDDLLVTRLVEQILISMGFTDVQTTRYPKTGLALILDSNNMGNPIDLIICDWMMPEITGIGLLNTIREYKVDVGFIMLTAKATVPDVGQARDLDVDAYIAKPFTSDQVQRKVTTVANGILRAKGIKTTEKPQE